MANPDLQPGALLKPAKGTGILERYERRREIQNHERIEKNKVRKRDKRRCRWPFCEHKPLKPRIEVAHLDDKGMGGDHGERTTADRMICLCYLHHQGAKSLHSGDLLIAPQTPDGTNGPCMFIELKPRYRSITETAVGIPERVDHD